MNKKQLIIGWCKKILAFIVDAVIIIGLYYFISFILLIGGLFLFGKQQYLKVENIFDYPFRILILIFYFIFVPKKFGNTFGRKIFKVKDKFNLFWSPLKKHDERCFSFPNKHLKKDKVLKVITKDGKWSCPSCNDLSLEIYDICGNCGQEVEKNNK